jgi:hypothetical protein
MTLGLRLLFGHLLLLCSMGLLAQCAMTTQVTNESGSGCLINDFGAFSVSTTGGTGPFTILVERHVLYNNLWPPELTATNDADGDLYAGINLYATDQLRATVTDALGCVAVATTSFEAHANVGSSILGTALDVCTGMTRVGFQPSPSNCPDSWLFSHTLIVDGVPQGLVSQTCVYDQGAFGIIQELSNGTHNINFSGTSCFPGLTECWYETSFTVENPFSGDCGVNFYLRAALDGALPSGTIMTDGLRAANLVPVNQPYTALGYTFVGSPTNVTITPALLSVTGNNAIVDWVVVELRNATTPATVVYSKPALLQRDGDVIDADGNPHVNMPVTAGNYYVALRHRNHLAMMTGTARALTVDPTANTIDFRTASTTTYGTNARVLKGTVYCLWAGDATGNGQLKYTGPGNDRDPLLLAVGSTTPNNTLNNVYDRRDTNLDGAIKYTGPGNDRDVILTNVGSTTPTNTRTQQLP